MSDTCHSKYVIRSPVAIGGLGGSGTRLVARILEETGFYMGSDLNKANDNLWFTFLFKRMEILSATNSKFDALVEIFINGMMGTKPFTESQIREISEIALADSHRYPAEWLLKRTESLLSGHDMARESLFWGWKEPNTHIVMDRLHNSVPGMKYIHVIRNGLDVAFSDNQSQLALWGMHFIGENIQMSPFYSLKYWHRIHKRILAIGEQMGARFLLLNFDELCMDPANSIKTLLGFLEIDAPLSKIKDLALLVKTPSSTGRFKQYGCNHFDQNDVLYVKELGFDTSV